MTIASISMIFHLTTINVYHQSKLLTTFKMKIHDIIMYIVYNNSKHNIQNKL